MTDVEGATNMFLAHSRNMMNIYTKYGVDILIISFSYGGHRQHETDYEARNFNSPSFLFIALPPQI